MTKTAVVALGGNAFTLPAQAAQMATAIDEVMDAGWRARRGR